MLGLLLVMMMAGCMISSMITAGEAGPAASHDDGRLHDLEHPWHPFLHSTASLRRHQRIAPRHGQVRA